MPELTDTFVDQLTRAATDARDVLAELRAEHAEIRRTRRDTERLIAGAIDQLRGSLQTEIEDIIRKIGTDLNETRDQAIDKIYGRVEKLIHEQVNMLMHGNRQGRGPSLFDQIEERLGKIDKELYARGLVVAPDKPAFRLPPSASLNRETTDRGTSHSA